jgi:hypothetical protein
MVGLTVSYAAVIIIAVGIIDYLIRSNYDNRK